jgi:Flp pilus assembly protein TadB
VRGPLAVLDRTFYALFSRHADRQRHAADRRTYRGTSVRTSFEVYLARLYGASWAAGLFVGALVAGLGTTVLQNPLLATTAAVGAALPEMVPAVGLVVLVGGIALVTTLMIRGVGLFLGGRYLRWLARARRTDIERTLPGAARYLHALAHGSRSEREMLERVADQEEAYGETAVAFRRVLTTASLTGSLDTGLRRVARDTPAQSALAPFLLKFREHANQGTDALAGYLDLESRMLGRRQERQRQTAEGFLELVAELFVVLLVLPTLLVIVLTVLGTLSPDLAATVQTPAGATTVRELLVYGSGAFVLLVGGLTAGVVHGLQPANVVTDHYERAAGWAVVRGATQNPADAAIVWFPLAPLIAGVAAWGGIDVGSAVLLGYATWGIPVGLVALRRARLDEAKDGQMKDFVHAVSSHVNLGRPLPKAVELVARDGSLGPLEPDVARLAFALSVTDRDGDVRTAALNAFVADVGTPLAEQTVGLLSGAIDVGSDTATVIDALQAEVGRLYHAKKAFRANLLVYAAIGWTTALLVIGVMVAVNLYVLGSFDRLAEVSAVTDGFVLQGEAVDPQRDQYRFYLVTQATMLACGWFAGYASRGRYEALLHSGLLVVLAYVVFAGVGAL